MFTPYRFLLAGSLCACLATAVSGSEPVLRALSFSYRYPKSSVQGILALGRSDQLSQSVQPAALLGQPRRTTLSDWQFWQLSEKFGRPERHVPTFAFNVGGVEGVLQLRSEALRVPIDGDRRLYYKSSKILYRYEPKRWPRSFSGFCDDAILMPLRSFFEKYLDF